MNSYLNKKHRRYIFITAFPKSGVTWLVHLMSDLLRAPQVGRELSTPLIHYEDGGTFYVVKQHAKFNQYDCKSGRDIILLQRDPRDIIISAMFFQNGSLDIIKGFIDTLCTSYESWYRSWFDNGKYAEYVKYEWLHDRPISTLQRLASVVNVAVSRNDVMQTFARQSVDNMRRRLGKHFVRRGIVGDWRNYFDKDSAKYLNDRLGKFMLECGYIDNLEWWRKLE